MKLISRAEAKAAGLKHYFTGKPCARGSHVAKRRVSNKNCCDCEGERASVYYANNSAVARKRVRLYQDKNKDSVRRWRSTPSYVARKPKYERDYRRRKIASDPDFFVAKGSNRRAKARDNGGSHTLADLKRILLQQGGRCAYSGYEFTWCKGRLTKTTRHVDHVTPVSKGGSNNQSNIQYLCQPCNQRKHNSTQDVFLRKHGLLI